MYRSIQKYKLLGFVKNVVFNIISSVLPLAVLQLVVFPFIARNVDSVENGRIISLIALLTFFAEPLGYALNNARLLEHKKYSVNNIFGDFNLLVLICLPINIIVLTYCVSDYMHEYSIVVLVLMNIASAIIFLQKYYMVYFRIVLDYNRVFTSNLLLSIGYLIGLYFFHITFNWILIYVFGGILALIFTLFKNPLVKEPIKRTVFFNDTLKSIGALLFVECSNSVIKYSDRLILYPLLGGNAVSIYYSATIISKLIAMAISPISTVILSYFSRMDQLSKKNFLFMLLLTTLVGSIGYVVCVIISKPILSYLYPKWAFQSVHLVYVTTATSVFDAISSVARPAVLKFRDTNFQYIIGSSSAVLYVILGLVFYYFGGLYGFCVGLMLNSFLQLLLRIFIFLKQ